MKSVGAPRNSLDTVFAVIGLFTEDRMFWAGEEIGEALGLGRTALSRCLRTLRESGLLIVDPGGCFSLGPRAVEMGYVLRRSDRLILAGHHDLIELSRARPCLATLIRWYGNRQVCVAFEHSLPRLETSYAQGRPLPIARGAGGRAILASLTRREQTERVTQDLDQFAGAGLGTTVPAVLRSLDEIRRAGFAVCANQVVVGCTAVASAIFDGGSTPIAALSLILRNDQVEADEFDRLGQDVARRAAAISARLKPAPSEDQSSHNLLLGGRCAAPSSVLRRSLPN